jgi:DNA polymerase-3 subunit gamma/tau
MASQLEREKLNLNKHLREVLNNFGITIKIVVNEVVAKNFAYTPQEKYEKLLELNPSLAKLKHAFKLDL